jgi:hypothetical protein
METLRLEGASGDTYGGGTGVTKDIISHAAWTQDFFISGQAGKERISCPLKS